MRLILGLLLSVAFAAQAQVAQLRTLNQLVNRPPAVDASGRGETCSVLFGWNTNDWGGEQRWTFYPNATDPTNASMAGPVVAAKGGGRWKHERATWDVQDARLWGIKADGVTDDTAAWQAALDYPAAALELRSGSTSVVTNVKITRPKRIIGNGATVVQVYSALTNMLSISSSDVTVSELRFNGRTNSNRGILITDDVDRVLVEKCYFNGFRENPSRARIAGIYGWGNNEVTIRNCWFQDFYGYPNGVIGDDLGDVKGIYFRRQFGTTTGQPKRVIVDGCVAIDILPGEDSDFVHYVDSTWTDWDSTFLIGNCYAKNVGKRFAKPSGSGASIFNNFVTNTFDGSVQATGWVPTGNRMAQYTVVSLYGKRHNVTGNRYNGGHIRLFGDGVDIMEDCVIMGNTLTLSTNWGLPGVTTNDFNLGTIGFSLFGGRRNQFIGNTWQVTQYGFHLWNPASDNKFLGNRISNPWLFASQDDNVSRGVRMGRTGPAYQGGSLMDNEFTANTFKGFKIGIETQEASNTVWIANNVVGSTVERSLIPYESGTTNVTHPVQFTGGSTASFRLIDPAFLAPINADTYASTSDRGQLAWDTVDKAAVLYNGRDWDDVVTETRRMFIPPVTMVWTNVQQTVTNTFPTMTTLTTNVFGGATNVLRSWWRVAELQPPGYGGRGSAVIKLGSGGGLTADSSVLRVSVNFFDPSFLLIANSPSTNTSGAPLYGVRYVRDIPTSRSYVEVCPATNLTLVGVTVQPEWQALAGLEPTNGWRAISITNTTILLTTNEAVVLTMTNLDSKVMGYLGANGEWWIGRNEMQVGTNRFTIDAPPSANATAMSVEVNGVKERVWRDATTGALYTGSFSGAASSHTHDASAIVSGTLNVARVGTGSGSSAKFLDGTGAFSTPPAGVSAAWNGVTNVGSVIQLNITGSGGVTITTNSSTGQVTISGPPASTNSGSVVSVDGTYSGTVNVADSAEFDGTLTGTNLSFALKANAVSSNKLDSAVITALNARGLGTNLVVNGALQQPARLTNAPSATTGRVLFVVNANGDIEGIATNLPAGGGGGLGTNLFVNGTLQQPARLTNAPAATTGGLRFLVNGNGDIEGYATNFPSSAGGSTTVHRIIGTSTFVYTNWPSGQFAMITNTGVITNAVASTPGSAFPLSITYDMSGVTTTNYIVTVDADSTDGAYGHVYWVDAGTRLTTGFKLEIGSAAGSITFAGSGYTYRVTVYDQATVGGSGGGYVNSQAVTNIAGTQYIAWYITNAVAYPSLTDYNFPERQPVFFDDMIYVSAPTLSGGGPAGTTANGTGAGASVIASESGEHGILQLSTGTSPTGNNRYQVGLSATAILLGGAAWEWEARVKMPTLSSATERYFVRVGFYDATSTNAVDGAYLEYVHDANSGNWVAKNYSNSTATTANCSVGPVANTWTTLKGVIDAGASACSYYVDGTLATTVSGGLPTGSGRETRFAIIIEASGGSTGIGADTMQIGYVKVTPTYSSAR